MKTAHQLPEVQGTGLPHVYTLKQLVDLNIESVPFLWQDYIPKNGFGILTGPSESNKSTLARQLAYSIALNESMFLNRPLTASRNRVLIIATEDGSTQTAALVRKQRAQDLPIEVQENVFFVFEPLRDMKALEAILTAFPVSLIILDTWTDSFREDLNSSIKVRDNLEQYNRLAYKHDCFILGIHHKRKGSQNQFADKHNLLGSGAIEAFSRTVFDLSQVKGHDNKRQLTIVKGNFVPDALKNKPLYLDLSTDFRLAISAQQSIVGPEASRMSKESSDKFKSIVKELIESGKDYTQDAIVKYLEDIFPDEKTPSKGMVNKWVNEIKDSQSQNAVESND